MSSAGRGSSLSTCMWHFAPACLPPPVALLPASVWLPAHPPASRLLSPRPPAAAAAKAGGADAVQLTMQKKGLDELAEIKGLIKSQASGGHSVSVCRPLMDLSGVISPGLGSLCWTAVVALFLIWVI